MKKTKSNYEIKLDKKKVLDVPPHPIEEEFKEEEKTTEVKKDVSLKDRIEQLNNKFDEIAGKKDIDHKFKKRSFKFPIKVKSQLRKGLIKNKIQVILLQMNKTLLPCIGEFKLGALEINTPTGLKSWVGEEDIIWNWNGKMPTALVPEWDLMPITRGTLIKDCIENKRLSAPAEIIIRQMARADTMANDKKKMDSKMLIWIFIIGAAGAWVLFGGGN